MRNDFLGLRFVDGDRFNEDLGRLMSAVLKRQVPRRALFRSAGFVVACGPVAP